MVGLMERHTIKGIGILREIVFLRLVLLLAPTVNSKKLNKNFLILKEKMGAVHSYLIFYGMSKEFERRKKYNPRRELEIVPLLEEYKSTKRRKSKFKIKK